MPRHRPSPKPSLLHYFFQLAVDAFLLPLYGEPLENNIGHSSSLHPQSQGEAWHYLGLLHCPAPGGPTGVGTDVTSPRSRWPAHGKGTVLLPSASFQEVPCHHGHLLLLNSQGTLSDNVPLPLPSIVTKFSSQSHVPG